jgi:putative peptide zinc metalloprotease protein
MTITLRSSLALIPLEIRKDKKHYIVQDKVSGEFFEMPLVCVDAIKLINNGMSLAIIEQQLREKYPEEEVDIIDFAEQLLEMHLITSIDDKKVESKSIKKESLGFFCISPKLGMLFFNKVAFLFYIGLFILNLILLISNSRLFPQYKDLFITDYMFLNIPIWLVISFFSVLIHEFGHILAMRAQNLPTKLEVGHRLFLVVLETDMSTVWKLPSKDRNVLFMAGICFDTVILSFALLSQLIVPHGSGVFLSIMNMIVLDTFIRMVYQLCVYMKTDLYYVIENVSGCYNLMENALQAIKEKISFLKVPSIKEVVFEGERRIVNLYSVFYFIGVALTVSLYTFFYVPQLLFAWRKILPGFFVGPTNLPFWDALFFSLQILIGLLFLLYSWRKKYTHM